MTELSNIFDLPVSLPSEELFESLISSENVLIERIISTGQKTPLGEWLAQEKDEWVILLQGRSELSYDNGKRYNLAGGNYLFIPAYQKHRVEYTSVDPPCIWLAIHGNFSSAMRV